MSRRTLFILGLVVAAGAVALRLRESRAPSPRRAYAPRASSLLPAAEGAGYSNILPGDYLGPEACKECHEQKYAAWHSHAHTLMNRDATAESVRGDFSGLRVPYEGGSITFAKTDVAGKPEFFMTLERDGKLVRRYRVTRTVGSRFMQFYIGIEVEGPEPANSAARTQEQKLPFGYWFRLARWFPTNYFDPVGPETNKDGTPVYDPFTHPRVHLWSQNCMLCHNTYAWVYRLALPNGLSGYTDGDLLIAADPLRAELGKTLDLSPREGVPATVRDRIEPRNLVHLGITCEACHLGGREHVKNEVDARYVPASPFVKLAPQVEKKSSAEGDSAYTVNHICAQCHCATVTRFPNGAGTWNSREALDEMSGKCASQMKCTDCHDPHKAGGAEAAEVRDQTALAACLKCHAKLATPQAQQEHAHHPVGANVTCLDCHMPRVTQGLQEAVRTHRIASPVEPVQAAAGSYNACNVCHLDKSIAWTLAALEKGWGKKIAAAPEWASAYGGSLDTPVGKAWLTGPGQSMRLVAAQAYSRSPLGAAVLPDLVRALDDPVPVNRVFAGFAVERVRKRALSPGEFDATASEDVRRRQVDALLGAAVK